MMTEPTHPHADRPPSVDLRYLRYLEDRLDNAGIAPKVERTRLRLEVAAVELLSDRLHDSLTVAEITGRCGLAHGTFYRYFENRRAIVLAVMKGLSKSVVELRPRGKPKDAYDAVLRMNRFYVEYYRQNAGLMRSYVRLKTEDPAFAEIGQGADQWLAARVLNDVDARRPALRALPSDVRHLLVYSVMGMVDEMLRKIYCGSNPAVTVFADRPQEIAEVLSAIWWRAVYGGADASADIPELEPISTLILQ